jgi:hypothetical protein
MSQLASVFRATSRKEARQLIVWSGKYGFGTKFEKG